MRPNVVLVSVDCLRADATYGDATETPFLDSLRDRSTVFEAHHATGAWTAPSFVGLMTGAHPRSHARDLAIDYYPETLAELLRESGYRTVATLDSNYWISAAQGFDRGFDSFVNFVDEAEFEARKRDEGAAGDANRLAELLPDAAVSMAPGVVDRLWRAIRSNDALSSALRPLYRAATITDRSVGATRVNQRFIEALPDGDEPVFGWVHYMDPHHPYRPENLAGADRLRYPTPRVNLLNSRAVNQDDPSEADIRALRYLYDRTVEDIDASIASLVRAVRDRLDGETVFVIVGDHGEEFGEHGKLTHANRPYEELIHVPLLVTDGRARRVDDLTSSIGLKDAIAGLVAGDDYLPALRTDPVCRYIGGDSVPARTKRALEGFDGVSPVLARLSDTGKCIYDGTFETYDLATDPDETQDVTAWTEHSELLRSTLAHRAIQRRQLTDQRVLAALR